VPFLGGAHRTSPIRAGFVLPFKKAQCFAPGWIYVGEMFDFFWRRAPIFLGLAFNRQRSRILALDLLISLIALVVANLASRIRRRSSYLLIVGVGALCAPTTPASPRKRTLYSHRTVASR